MKMRKNILFVFGWDVSPSVAGGATAMTHILADGLAQTFGCGISLAYFEPHKVPSPVQNKIQIQRPFNSVKFERFISENKIETVIVSLLAKKDLWFLPELYYISQKSDIKVIRWQHFMPGEELAHYGSSSRFCYAVKKKKDVKRQLFYYLLTCFRPVVKPLAIRLLRAKYRLNYNYSDATVLLSEQFFTEYKKILGIKNADKLCAINNSNTQTMAIDNCSHKEKVVLLAARMDEPMKRISMALRIWSIVEKTGQFDEWKFVVCGRGEDLEYERYLAKRLELKNCSIKGYVEEIPYKQASIFIMTSAFEGWGLTLTEAQQNGVIPIAFDSYSSLHDIIQTGSNGIIVPNNKIKKFAKELMKLMSDKELREKLMSNALESSSRFTIDKVIEKWEKLLF
jgi:glycosyltransferase involved in cell wall biosynthesis